MLIVPTQHIGMSFAKKEKQGKLFRGGYCLGWRPDTLSCGSSSLKYTEDEYGLAGALRGEPLDLVKCETADSEVPATSECVIEGEILPKIRNLRGLFGEYTGYYGAMGNRPVFRVKCITHCNPYIFLALMRRTLSPSE
jgi:2,5-furandicarboxylate decarboxylase 1